MYGRYKRRRSTKASSFFSKKRRRVGRTSSAKGFLPGKRGSLFLQAPTSKRTDGGSPNYPKLVVQRNHTWLPDRMRIPLKWTATIATSTVAGVGFQLTLSANNLNDPGGSSAASQPYGFDVIKLAYQNFVVLGSSIRATCNVVSSGTTSYATCLNDMVVWPQALSTSYVNDVEGAKQQPYSKYSLGLMNTAAQTPFGFPTIQNYASTSRMAGRPFQQIYSDGSYHGSFAGTDPTLKWFWNILVNPQGNVAGNANSYYVEVEMIMYTEVYGLGPLAST